ncbi:unnamed protein product, partial [Polarella glacialis]
PSLGVAMRNRGPGKWRDWRWGQIVIPLYPLDVVPPTPDPAAVVLNPIKPLSEVAYQTISALQAKNFLPKLTDALGELVKQPDSPGGRFQEQRLRDCFKDTASALLEPEEMEKIFPSPVVPEPPSKSGSRRPSKSASRKPTKEVLVEPKD